MTALSWLITEQPVPTIEDLRPRHRSSTTEGRRHDLRESRPRPPDGPRDHNDPRVLAAQHAERRLYDHYELEPTHHLVTLPRLGLQVHLSEIGSGAPVLIVPGNTDDGFPFVPLPSHLPGRRVIVLDRPGGGLSEGVDHTSIGFRDLAAYTLSTVLDSLGLGRVPIVAHSIGGHRSQWFVMDHPERVTALGLHGAPGNVLTTHHPLALRLASVGELSRSLVRATIRGTPRKTLNGLRYLGHSPQTLQRRPDPMAERHYTFDRLPNYQLSTQTLVQVTNRPRGSKPRIRITAAELATVHALTALLWGENDPFGDVGTGKRIAALSPHGQFQELPGGGHLPWLDDPQTAGRLVIDLLRRTEQPATARHLLPGTS